jgi:hypothetical protein
MDEGERVSVEAHGSPAGGTREGATAVPETRALVLDDTAGTTRLESPLSPAANMTCPAARTGVMYPLKEHGRSEGHAQ